MNEYPKWLFVYLLSKNKDKWNEFYNIVHYIYFNSYPIEIKIKEEWKNQNGLKLLKEIKKNIESFEEMEFLNLLYNLSKITDLKILKNQTKKKKLKDRILDILGIEFEKIQNETKNNISIFDHFFGAFESGLENTLFSGIIPNNITENELYTLIKKMNRELDF